MQAPEILKNLVLPLSAQQLEANDFFTLYPPDGGGGFVMQQELGSLDDAKITRAIIHEDILHDFGTLPEINYTQFEYWKTIERSCWINRLYFIVPLARTAFLTKDAALARLVLDTILYFHRTQPAPADKETAQNLHKTVMYRRDVEYNQGLVQNPAPVPYQWFDFQPASRIIHTIHALWFLRALDVFTADTIAELHAFIDNNARVIADQEEALDNAPGNHQALRGLALLFAGAMFQNQRYLTAGARIMEGHAVLDFHPDGLLAENSPTYHCFETWIIRDSCLLARANHFPLGQVVFDTLAKAQLAVQTVCRPDGRAVLLNDGCNLTVKPLLDTLGASADSAQGLHTLPDSGIASLRTPQWFALLDASHGTGRFSHYHAGKNGLTIWFQNRPFLVDSGCCNYDDPHFKDYFKLATAHNTVLVNNQGDGELRGSYEWLCCADAKLLPATADNTLAATLTTAKWPGVSWQRSLTAHDDSLTVNDRLTAPADSKITFVFNLHPDVAVKNITADSFVLDNHGTELIVTLKLTDSSADNRPLATAITEQQGCFCDNMAIQPSRQILLTVTGKNLSAEFEFSKQ